MSLRDFYATQIRVLWEWRGGRVALLKRLILVLVVATVSFLATAWLMPRLTVDGFVERRPRRHPHRPVQRGRPASPARFRGACLARPGRRPGACHPGRHVRRRRAMGAGRPCRRLRDCADRVLRVRDHQHDPDGHPRRRPGRILLRPARPAAPRRALEGALPTSPAWSSSRSTGWPIRSWPAGCAPGRSTRWRAWSATAVTSCRAGRRSCRR